MATVASESKNYPTRDGKPVAETDLHRDIMVSLISMLKRHYERDPMIYVSGNLLIFYEPGNKRRHVAPDVFVVKGVAKKMRDNYLLWEEGKGPDLVIEVTSSSTKKEDVKKKYELYRDVLKVPEYFLFDPRGDYLMPPLKGYRLRDGDYQPLLPEQGRLRSETLGLELVQEGSCLRLYDHVTGQPLLSADEELQRRDKELNGSAPKP